MANIPATHNRPVTGQRSIRRGRQIPASEGAVERSEQPTNRRDRRHRGDRRKQQLKVRFERRNKIRNRRGQANTQNPDDPQYSAKIGRNINTIA